MRQNHAAGDKLFVDYAGDTVTVVVDRLKGKTRQAHLFVAVLGASSLSYVLETGDRLEQTFQPLARKRLRDYRAIPRYWLKAVPKETYLIIRRR